MKTVFTKEEILKGKGCYPFAQAAEWFSKLSENGEVLTIKEILDSEISIKDKRWLVYNSCELALAEKKKLSLMLAWSVLPIFETKYPEDNRVRLCLEGIEKFNLGEISEDVLRDLRRDAYAAADAAADAYAAAAAAAAADAAAADAYAACAAAAASKDLTYTQKLNLILVEFVK